MPNQWDLTNENIENTYQRVLQTPDGVNIYDGTGSLFSLGLYNTATGSYGSFYSTSSQFNVANIPQSISFGITDISNGVFISGSSSPFNTYIKITNAGIYSFNFSAQISKTGSSDNDDTWVWLRQNGVDVSGSVATVKLINSNGYVSNESGSAFKFTNNWFVEAAANDYYQIVWYSSDPDVKLLAETASGLIPNVPSATATITRIDTFLSNTGSFSGSFTGDGSGLTGVTAVAAPAGPNQSVQFNDAGTTSGSGNFTFNKATNVVTLTGSLNVTDSIYFSGSGAASRLRWNDTDGTLDLGLKGGNVTLQVGQEEVARVVNKTGIDLLEINYQAVRISGAQGNRIKVALAKGDADGNSLDTLGLVTETILNNQEGFVTTYGLVRDIDTRGNLQGETWNEGDQLYLSPTTFGAITNIPPVAPSHSVRLGYVVQKSPNGSIFVKVDNGYEIDELHNVKINTSSLAYGDLLVYDTNVWQNTKQLTGSYGLTGSLNITGSAVIDVSSSSEAFRITQRGTGLALRIEDENNPDLTPFVVNASGNLGIGTDSPAYRLDVTGSGDGLENVIARIGNILVGDWDPGAGYGGYASMRHKSVARDNYAFIQGSNGVTYFGGSTAQYFGLGGISILKLELGGGAGTGSLIPDTTRVADLGSSTNLFRDLYLKNNAVISGSTISILGFTGSLQGTASWASSASQALTASYVTGSIYDSTNLALSASYALTASYALNAGSGGGGGTNLGLVYAVSLGYLMP